MKRFSLLIVLFAIIGVIIWNKKPYSPVKKVAVTPLPSPTTPPVLSTSSLFVPYWNIPESTTDISMPSIGGLPTTHKNIYFGLKANTKGIDTLDQGFKNLVSSSIPYDAITLRLLDTDFNLQMLENSTLQEKIIHQTIDTAHDAKASEVIVDLELSALPFTKLQTQITNFFTLFSEEAKRNSLSFGVTIYGDHFYRHRPFDLQALSRKVDMFYIMAYDLHKSAGTPGPNFPLSGKEKYGTDLEELTDQLLTIIPKEKINVIFGLYGYDWMVDENKHPLLSGKALPLVDIRTSFLDSCAWKNCVVSRDPLSKETEVDYVDKELRYHIVWFEDEKSIEEKVVFLKSKGIENYSIWVWGYY